MRAHESENILIVTEVGASLEYAPRLVDGGAARRVPWRPGEVETDERRDEMPFKG